MRGTSWQQKAIIILSQKPRQQKIMRLYDGQSCDGVEMIEFYKRNGVITATHNLANEKYNDSKN